MIRFVAAVLLAAILLLSGCARLIGPGGQPIPGPTPSGTPTGTVTGLPGGGDDPEQGPVDEVVTEGPDVTG
jgi:hypothetical protein